MDVDDNIKPKQQPPFNKNLIRNHSGNLGFSEWSCSASEMSIEHPPYRSNPHPFLHIDHCFVTSFFMATKTLTVDLIQEGFDADILDKQRPPIRVSEYVNHRDDCGAVYQLNVLLKDEKDRPIKTTKGQPETAVRFDAKIEMRQWKDLEWVKVEHVFDSYPAGVRKVEITSGGKDTQFWSGNYGAKMALASVVAEDKTKLEETKELFDMTRAREDILEQILVRVHPKTLLQAVPLVCQRWSELLSQQSFWVEQARVTGFEFGWIPKSGSVWETIFRSNPRLYRQKPFNRNLIPNSSGEDRTRHWAITNDEIIPRDLDITELNPQVPTKRCFATNDYGTEHSIVVDLTEYGIDAHILEQMRPRIRVSEWFTKIKPDAKYEFTAKLLDEQGHLSGEIGESQSFSSRKTFRTRKECFVCIHLNSNVV
ncbi:hypothetical protein L596_011619 [Steinernema carpocapsae]|uniref:F-box domain-containing protein n=1 Tax=Steinernema carpocapsae TaxID=34508 RepID=A0A4U5NUX5_STECR|nr:hypothetical protein L596_011619 [Steinernema carpocapsae]